MQKKKKLSRILIDNLVILLSEFNAQMKWIKWCIRNEQQMRDRGKKIR